MEPGCFRQRRMDYTDSDGFILNRMNYKWGQMGLKSSLEDIIRESEEYDQDCLVVGLTVWEWDVRPDSSFCLTLAVDVFGASIKVAKVTR